MRMLSSVGQIDNNKLKSGHLEHEDWRKLNEAISKIKQMPDKDVVLQILFDLNIIR